MTREAPPPPTRRRLLLAGGAALLAGAAGWGGTTLVRRRRRAELERAVPRLLAALGDPEAFRTVGESYLAQTPGEDDARRLARDLFAALGGVGVVDSADAARAALSRRVAADFAAGDTVRVEDWFLSRTEVRLAALAALAGAPPTPAD